MKKIKWLLQPNYFFTTLMQLLLPIFVYLAFISSASWYYWFLTFVFYFLYLAIGNNVGFHRYFCHRYFEMSKPVEWFVTWLSSISFLGSPVSYAIIHDIHHRNPDKENDIHGPTKGLKSVLYYYHRHINPAEIRCTKNISFLAKKYYYLHHYYTLFVLFNALLFLCISWEAFLFCWAIPASMTLWATAIVLLMQHDENGPSNTRAYQWFGWGETFHKNHHNNPGLANHALDSKDKDWTYLLCKLLAKRGTIE